MEPTNAELLEAFKNHAADDHEVARKQGIVNNEFLTFKAETEGTLALLATKDDIAELKQFMKEIKVGFGIVKFSWDNAAKIGSFLLLIGGLFVFFKMGFAAMIAWFASSNPVR